MKVTEWLAASSRSLPLPLVLGILVLVAGLPGLAQSDRLAEADSAFRNSDWSNAARAYDAVTQANPDNGRAWFRLGLCHQSLDQAAEAIAAFDRAESAGFQRQAVLYEKARSYGSMRNEEKARELLDEVSGLGPSRRIASTLATAEEFSFLAQAGVLDGIVAALTPCSATPYRQFDFWLGDWKVEDPSGREVGRNRVTSHLGGCLILESWVSVTGNEGMSFNYYDSRDDRWYQIYRDSTGNVGNWPLLKGGMKDDVMVLDTPTDEQTRSRWRWQKLGEGRVRQWAESSNNQGKTWTLVWDSVYVLESEP